MQIKVKIQNKVEEVEFDGETIEGLLRKMKINTEAVLVKRNGSFVPAEDKLKEKDEIELIRVTSSG